MSAPSVSNASHDGSLAGAFTQGHQCSQCGKIYARRTHLRRHESSHGASRPVRCPFCDRTFARTDGLRRHTGKCPKGNGRSLPLSIKRGRKLEACDGCSTSKVLCDKKIPCQRCSSRGLTCSYSRRKPASSSPSTSNDPCSSAASDLSCQADDDTRGNGMPLLLSLTDPAASSMAEALALEGVGLRARSTDTPEPSLDGSGFFGQRSPGLSSFYLSESEDGTRRPFYRATADASTASTSNLSFTEPHSHELNARMSAIVSELSQASGSTQNTTDGHNFDVNLARRVFSSENLSEFTATYFKTLHPHFPLLHRPTFRPQHASSPLLLAVFLAGAAASAPRDHALSARQFFHVGERYVYRCLDAFLSHRPDILDAGSVELLQAALLINSILTQVTDAGIRRRVRTQRHPQLVAALRLSKILGTRHDRASKHDWNAFVASEARVRLGSFAFLWDCYATISSNSPPQMAPAEMRGDMPCSERLHEAETASEFAYLQPTEHDHGCQRPLRDLVAALFEDEWRASSQAWVMRATTQPRLLLLICAVHTVLSQNRASLLGQTTLKSVWFATERWRQMFDREREASSRLAQYRHLDTPFTDRSLEFWRLARKLVREIRARGDGCEYLKNIGDDSYQSFRSFLLAEEETGQGAMR